ncbi:MAG TPA: hypothetical protein VJ896_01065, partial [Bacteroidales bacterium]|nr:hypothetical protein [Bacteroidales bacterium]
MKTILKSFILLMLASLLLVSCKDDDYDPGSTIDSPVVGTWMLSSGNEYVEVLDFRSEGDGILGIFYQEINDPDPENTRIYNLEKIEGFSWEIEDDQIVITFNNPVIVENQYHPIRINAHEPIILPFDVSNEQLSIAVTGQGNKYDLVPGEPLEMSELNASWKYTEGDYTGFMSFSEGLGSGLGSDSFIADDQSGMTSFRFLIVGSAVVLMYPEKDKDFYGDYKDYNQISEGDIVAFPADIEGDQLTFTYNGEPYIYTRFDGISLSDIEGSWEYTEGDYTDIITFNEQEQYGISISGSEAFYTETESGFASTSSILDGNILTIRYNRCLGDFESYNEISDWDYFTTLVRRE